MSGLGGGLSGGGARRALGAASMAIALAGLGALSGRLLGQPGAEIAPPAAAAAFDREVVPARERQVTLLTVPEFGRYSLVAESRVGVALQVVDRMGGAGAVAGEAGARDGRIDLFLDRGEVRVVALGPTLGRGEARLSARTFRELSLPEPPRLVEERTVSTELGDLEQRSWWLEIPARRRVVLEAAGRHLADLRLWQNGAWLVDAEPQVDAIVPVEGRPLTRVRLAADLAPGLYRLTAYGGVEQPWAKGGAERPLHLRWGIPRRSVAGREAMTVGPFGVERFLVPSRANHFRLELPAARPAALGLAAFDPEQPFAEGGRWTIDKESLPPVAEASFKVEQRSVLVTVEGAAGQPFLLQHFDARRRVELSGQGRYWIGSVHAGAAADSIDATGVLFARPAGAPEKVRVVAAQAVELSPARAWFRRFNLLDRATLFLHVSAAATYQLALRGAAAEARLEPLLLDPPAGYEPPPLAPAPAEWQLDPGYYLLTLVPKEAGIVEAALRPKGGAPSAPAPLAGALRLGVVELRGDTSYVLLINDQPGVVSGPIARQLPLDLEASLPLSLAPGETVEIPARARVASVATARAEDGTRLELAGAAGEWREELELPAGEQRIRVRSTRSETVAATLGFEPVARRAATPLPALPPEARAALPDFPRLAAGAERFFDLERAQAATFLVDAGSPALYLLETTGLLATGGELRTRVRPRLAEAAENGSGRNAALRAYLREGDYQLTVRARGESAGHLGVRLRRAEIADGGRLADGEAARASLAAEGAVAYRFAVGERSTWRLRALALGGGLAMRVEDLDGWPVGPAVVEGDATFELEPGEYRVVVLPRGTPARALTRLDRQVEAERRAGHGPHALPLGAEVAHVWTEPEAGAERAADRWLFSLPAAAHVSVTLTAEMAGELIPLAGAASGPLGVATPSRPFRGELAAGDYALDVRCSRRNHLAPYTLAVTTEELVAGVEREVSAPATLTVAAGGDGELEISSFGGDDVRARLFAGDGAPIAASDDRPDDWNFLISRRLPAGRYRLRIDPVGAAAATTRVAVRRRGERAESAWSLAGAAARAAEPAADAVLVPLELERGAELVAVGARAAEPVALALERRAGATWREAAAGEGRELALAVPLDQDGLAEPWRLRVRSLDGRATPVALTGFAGAPARASEAALARGATLSALPGLAPPLALLAVGVDRPGCFQAVSAPADVELLAGRRPGEALQSRPGALVAAGARLWLAARQAGAVAARRVAVGVEPLVVALAAGERVRCDLAPAGAGETMAVQADALAGELTLAAFAGSPPARLERGAAFASHRAFALASGATAVEVGNAGPTPVEARLSARALSVAGAGALAAGELDLTLPARSARRVELPAGGATEVGAALAPGTAVAADERLAWSAGGATFAELAAAGELLVANPTDAEATVRLERAATTERGAAVPLAAGAPFERRFTRAGWLALDVAPAGAGARLEVRGASAMLLAGADGSLARGDSIALPGAGGTLFVEHGAGTLVVWIASGAGAAADAGFAPGSPDAESVALPALLELAGARRALAIELPAPAMLTLRSPSPAAVAVRPAGGEARAEVFAERLSWTLALPAGRATVELRGLGGESLAGRLELAAAPVLPAAEGLGAPLRLAPGAALGYGFTLDGERAIGVGVAADSGGAEVLLFDAGGRPLGRGAALFRTLPAGDYRFALVAPAEGAPVLARPALVGLAAPPSAPPEDAVRALLAAERGEAPAPRAITGGQDARRWVETGAEASDDEGREGDSMDGEAYENEEGGDPEDDGARGGGADGGAR